MPQISHNQPEILELIDLMEHEIAIEDIRALDDETLDRLEANLDYWRAIAATSAAHRAKAKAAQHRLLA